MAFWTFPSALSLLPSAVSLASPRALPAVSLMAPLASLAEPTMRSLSISSLLRLLMPRGEARGYWSHVFAIGIVCRRGEVWSVLSRTRLTEHTTRRQPVNRHPTRDSWLHPVA